jgi:hypothetical protein
MSAFDDRARRARDDLASAFDDVRAPEFGVLQSRQRRRRVAAGGVATVVVLALGVAAIGTIGRDDPSQIAAVDTTSAVRAARPTVPPTPSVAPTTASTPPTTDNRSVTTSTSTAPSSAEPALAVDGVAPLNAVAVRDDGTLVRLRTDDGTVMARLAREGNPRNASAAGGTNLVITSAAMTPTGTMFYDDCCQVGAGKVYRVGKAKLAFADGDLPALSPDGRRLAVYDKPLSDVRVVDVASHKVVRRLRVGPQIVASGEVTRLALADDGRIAIETFAGHAQIAVYSATTTDPMSAVRLRPPAKSSYTDPVFLPDGRLAYVDQPLGADGRPTGAGTLVVAASQPGRAPANVGLLFGVLDLAVSKSGHLLVACSDHVLRTYDGRTWRDVARGYTAADW